MVLPGKVTVKGLPEGCDAGAPLTAIFAVIRSSAPLDGSPALIGLARCRRPRDGEQPHTQRGGASRPASASRAVGLSPERARLLSTPRARAVPRSFLAELGPGGHARTLSRIPLRHFAFQLLIFCAARPTWRAGGPPLNPYRKFSHSHWRPFVVSRLILYTSVPLDG